MSCTTQVLEQTSIVGSLPVGIVSEMSTIAFCPVFVTLSERVPLPFPDGTAKSPSNRAWSLVVDDVLKLELEVVVEEEEAVVELEDEEVEEPEEADELEVLLVVVLVLEVDDVLKVDPPETVMVVETTEVTVVVSVRVPEELSRELIC